MNSNEIKSKITIYELYDHKTELEIMLLTLLIEILDTLNQIKEK